VDFAKLRLSHQEKEKFGLATGLVATSGSMDVKVIIQFYAVKLQLELLCEIHHTTVFRSFR